MESSSIPYI